MNLETVLYRVEGAVAVVSMNRTKAMNSLNKQIFADLTVAFEAAKADDAVRCVVLNAEGRAFCAGGDIAEMKGITTEEAFFDFMSVAGGFTTLLNTFPKPVITAAHGAIAGAGTSLLMAGDIALVADNAMFIVAFGQVGLVPDCACHYLLPRVVGPNIAKELMLTQRVVKADEMKELGIANYVYPAEQLQEEAMKLANKIARGPLNCYAASKAMMNKAHETTLDELLKEETAVQAAVRMHPNAEEGLGAFLEKRKAAFV
jgi:2-(1,2-epoxy-1,2-dihydrophenyl)acetyl-CoA isomerase